MEGSSVDGSANSSTVEETVLLYQKLATQQSIPGETPGYRNGDPLAFAMSTVPIRTQRPLKIICCGAGISGLNLAHEVDVGEFGHVKLSIYEKNSDIGGTWFENRYPGLVSSLALHARSTSMLISK